MCGRYTIIKHDQIVKVIQNFTRQMSLRFDVRYNAAIGQNHPIIMNGNPPTAALAKWGLVPSWSQTGKMDYDTFNAKSETLAEKRTFAPLLRHRRCLVPADGFIEWRTTGKTKHPHHIHLKSGAAFCFAGLWDCWHDELLTYTIITTSANEVVRPLHQRMPVILQESDFQGWMNTGNVDLLRPFPAEQMEAIEINLIVNSAKVDSPNCMMPPLPKPAPAQTSSQSSLFDH